MGNTSSSSIGTLTSEYAKARSFISMIIGIPISLILLGVGVFLLYESNKYAPVNATVIDNICTTIQNRISCSNTLSYNVNSKVYTAYYIVTNFPTIKGSTMIAYYEINNPGNISVNGFPSLIGWVLIGFSILSIIGLILNYYLVNRYEGYAEGIGGIELVSDTLGIFRK